MTIQDDPMPENLGVARCVNAGNLAYSQHRAAGKDSYDCSKAAKHAYRRAMPMLKGEDNIRNFIACVAFGLLVEAIDEKCSTKLLYAAQVALTMVRRQTSNSKTSSDPSDQAA